MPNKAKLAHFFFGGKILLVFLFLLSFFLGHKIANAIIINTIDDASQWVTSNAGVLSIEQDTGIKQEGTGSAKIVATQGEATWYNTSYGNRKPVTITHSGSELTNADILIEIDTASLVSAGKLQSDCDDLRFTDSDGTTVISYWIESGCNTAATQVWADVPSIPDGGKTIYFYYNYDSATNGEASWSGNFILMNDEACPAGWTQVSELNSAFPYGSSSWSTTGGTSSHAHAQVSGTSGAGSASANSAIGTSTRRHVSSSHTHSSVQADVNTASNVLPPYLDMVFCKKDEPVIPTGMIALFDSSTPSGWTRFSALDSKFPRGNTSYGGTGGAETHTHTTTGGYGTGSSGDQAAGSSGDSHMKSHAHTSQSGNTGAGNNVPPYLDMVYAEVNSEVIAPAGVITMSTNTPPLGWTRFSALDSKFPRGNTSYSGTGGAATHTHSVTVTTDGPTGVSWNATGCCNFSSAASGHTHSMTTTTDSQSNLPPYVETVFVKRNSSAASTAVGSEQQNGANNHTVTDTIDATDFSGYEDISFYVRANRTGAFTRFEIGEAASSEQTFAITINGADTWELKTWDISGITSTAIDAVTKMAFRVTDASTGFTMYFDNLRANSAPGAPTVSTPANDTWTNSRQFCATATDADGDTYNTTFVLSGIGSYDGETVASGEASCYTHTTDLSSVSWYANATDSNTYVSSNTSSYTAKIDSVAPTSLSGNNSSADWVTDKPTVTISTPTDATSGINEIRYSWANDLGADCTGGTVTTGGADLSASLTQGSRILYLCASDNASNVTTWNGPYKWDNGNPLVNLTSHVSTTYNASNIPSTIAGTASDIASVVASVAVTISDGVNYWSGAAWDSATRVWLAVTGTTSWSTSFVPNKDGSFSLESKSTDSAGNTSSYDTVSFSYDSLVPGISTTPSVSSITNTGATISWDTDETTSTRVQYGPSSSYGGLTALTDTSPRVTSHSVTLSSLRACTTYHYKVLGTDTAGNQVAGTDRTFTTTGCVGSATVESETRSEVTTASGGTVELEESGDKVTLTVPPSFSGSNATFQVKKLNRDSVLAATSTPTTSLNAVGNNVYQLDALTDSENNVTSFDEAITVTINYTAADVASLDESSLLIYRWDGTSWNELTDCIVDTDANSVTCTTVAFSTFVLFGSEPASSSSSAGGPAPTCDGPAPGNKAPWLYGAIPQNPTSVTLYFADGDAPIQKYLLIYGQSSNNYTYGAENIGGRGDGWRQYTVDELQPGTTYYFRVRGENDCFGGPWSNEFMVTTPTSFTSEAADSGETEPQSLVDSIEIAPLGEQTVCQSYTVQAGDSLSLISQEMLGDAQRYPEMIETNQARYSSLTTNPNYIEIGWELSLGCDLPGDGNSDIILRVTDNREQPIAGIRVLFAGQETTLNDSGQATFTAVESGTYTIALYNDEGLVAERNVQIDAGASSYEILLRLNDRSPWGIEGLPWHLAVIQEIIWFFQWLPKKISSLW